MTLDKTIIKREYRIPYDLVEPLQKKLSKIKEQGILRHGTQNEPLQHFANKKKNGKSYYQMIL